MAVYTYDPKMVSVIAGTSPLGGFADGEFITLERNEDTWTRSTGADGESTRTKNANKSGTATLTLMQSSASNDVLSGFHIADEATGNATFPLLIKDNRGTTVASAATAWIRKLPSTAYGKESGTRQWVIETDELLIFVGGNT